MSIKEKLARLDTASKPIEIKPHEDHSWIANVESELQVKVIRENNSFFLLREKYFPIFNDEHLQILSGDFEIGRFAKICGIDSKNKLDFKNAIFIDLETTGLAGGTGTYAFLIGLGHLELNNIVVRQYLLPDFNQEWLMLKYVDHAIQNFEYMATFNGKSFDIPLLTNRFILNRMDTSLEDKEHLDLLHACRRIWKLRLPSCDLQSLENSILGQNRVGDIPGDIIPALYFEFIRKRQAHILFDVLEHNFYDIVNLILLSLELSEISEDPVNHLNHPEDLFCLANFFHNNNHFDESIPLLERVFLLPKNINHDLELRAFFLLGMAHKKMGNTEASKRYLWELLDRQHFHPNVVEELSKFYEHQDKDFSTAKEIVEKGLQYLTTIQQLDSNNVILKFIPRLRHREKRLLKKMAASQTSERHIRDEVSDEKPHLIK